MGIALETRPRCVDDSKQMKREREMRMNESWGMITIFQATLRVWDRNKGSGQVNDMTDIKNGNQQGRAKLLAY